MDCSCLFIIIIISCCSHFNYSVRLVQLKQKIIKSKSRWRQCQHTHKLQLKYIEIIFGMLIFINFKSDNEQKMLKPQRTPTDGRVFVSANFENFLFSSSWNFQLQTRMRDIVFSSFWESAWVFRLQLAFARKFFSFYFHLIKSICLEPGWQ